MDVKTGKARLALRRNTVRVGAIVPIRSLVRIHLAAVWREGGRPDRQSTATQGIPSGRPASLRPVQPTSANAAGSPIARPTTVERVTAKAERFDIGGMKPGRQPAHRCG